MSKDTRPHLRSLVANVVTYFFLLAGALVMVVPFVFSVLTSVKTPQQFNTTTPLAMPDPVTGENYLALFGQEHNFTVPIVVTIQVVVVLVVGQLVCSILAAYAFSHLRFPGRDALFRSEERRVGKGSDITGIALAGR